MYQVFTLLVRLQLVTVGLLRAHRFNTPHGLTGGEEGAVHDLLLDRLHRRQIARLLAHGWYSITVTTTSRPVSVFLTLTPTRRGARRRGQIDRGTQQQLAQRSMRPEGLQGWEDSPWPQRTRVLLEVVLYGLAQGLHLRGDGFARAEEFEHLPGSTAAARLFLGPRRSCSCGRRSWQTKKSQGGKSQRGKSS